MSKETASLSDLTLFQTQLVININQGSKWGKRTTGMTLSLPLLLSFPLFPYRNFLSLPLPFPLLSSPPLTSLPLEVGPLNPAMGSGRAL